ncbi:MAG: 50S ribosomal protein L35 [Planctomycetes bacterium RBG_16_43_13]|nr:MAG: 50S ribosomal protein L35 [Planctomycetes bacterium RBG_16_43_13]
MPKLRTNKAARKRFKVTARGKVLYRKSSRRHLLSTKSRDRKRNLKKVGVLHDRDAAVVKRLLVVS